MNHQLLTIILLTLLAIAAFLAWGVWRHFARHRDYALRYETHSRTPPPSAVCPQCRRRSYGRRAVADRHCPHCDMRY